MSQFSVTSMLKCHTTTSSGLAWEFSYDAKALLNYAGANGSSYFCSQQRPPAAGKLAGWLLALVTAEPTSPQDVK